MAEPKDLYKASEKLAYEVNTLTSMLSAFSSDGRIHNAFVHTFLLAARNLYGFFTSKDKRDIRAEDFLGDGFHWPEDPTVDTILKKGFKEAVDQRLAHITWNRVTEPKIRWDFKAISWAMAEVLLKFLSKVQADRISEELSWSVAGLRGIVHRPEEATYGWTVRSDGTFVPLTPKGQSPAGAPRGTKGTPSAGAAPFE